MYGLFQAFFGFLFLVSVIALIKPSLFHRFYKDLSRKHAGIALVATLIIVNSGIGKLIDKGATKETQETNQVTSEQQAARQAEAEQERLAREQKEIEEAAKQAVLAKITITPSVGKNIISITELSADIKNGTDKTIDGIEFFAYFTNNFGEPVGEWGKKSEDPLKARSQEVIQPGKTARELTWTALGYDAATKVSKIVIDRVHFTDGTTIEGNE
ncbi:hypothetical protein KBD61_01350 [Patescibacteria group bacterium]|nr:hypothetical protein [Patescibacteria group bacterium]MBP9709655.1 hypothetical protein [Patescibacteria group bacterium]